MSLKSKSKYKVLEAPANYRANFEAHVQELIRQGWLPVGFAVAVDVGGVRLYQALVYTDWDGVTESADPHAIVDR